MLVNLLTGTANRGNLPSCSCVLRETLETVEISLTLFSSWLWLQKQLGHSGMRRWGRVRCFSITLPHQSRSSPLKRAAGEKKTKLVVPKLDQVCGNQYCCLHEGPPLRLFHISPYIHSFWGERKKKKTQPLNFRTVWTIDFTVTILTLSLPISVLSLFHSPPLMWNSFPPPPKLLLNENCLLLGFSRRRGRYRHIFTSFTFLLKEMFFPLTSRIDRSVRWNRKAISWQKWIPLPLPCTLLRY